MRYRKLVGDDRDYVLGRGPSEFYVDNPEAVAQACETRLLLATGEWFLDLSAGTPYSTQILGFGTTDLYDQAIRERILGTPNVVSIQSYSSVLDTSRALTVSCLLNTAFGQIALTATLG